MRSQRVVSTHSVGVEVAPDLPVDVPRPFGKHRVGGSQLRTERLALPPRRPGTG